MAGKQPDKKEIFINPEDIIEIEKPTELEKAVSQAINEFFIVERDNRVTINNVRGLMFTIQTAFNKNKVLTNDRSREKTKTNTET